MGVSREHLRQAGGRREGRSRLGLVSVNAAR
jgi:hypothetical protein